MADSLEYRTIFECFGSLVTAFKGDPVAIADELAAVSLIPPPQDVADQKKSDLARRLAEDIRDRVKLSPSRYEDVVRVLSKHKWLEDIVKILQYTNDQLKVKDRQAVSTCVTAECDQSDGGKKLLSYRFGYDLGEIPHCKSTLKVPNPVVSFASLDEDDLEDLQAQMSELTKEIKLQFDKFFDAIFTSFRDSKQIDRDKIVVILTNKEAVFEKDELEGAKSMYDVFRMIRYHCSYFNYDVLTTVIQVHGSDQDKMYLEEYNKAFTEYCKAMPCAEGVCGNESSKSRRTKLKFKLDYELEQLKPNDVLSIKNNIARCLGIRLSSLYLCRVKEGCVLLEFLVPDFIVEKVFPLSDSQILELHSEVKVLSIEHHAFHLDITSQPSSVTTVQATNDVPYNVLQNARPMCILQLPVDTNMFSRNNCSGRSKSESDIFCPSNKVTCSISVERNDIHRIAEVEAQLYDERKKGLLLQKKLQEVEQQSKVLQKKNEVLEKQLETQLDGERKKGLVLETRVQEVEQLAEERKTNMDELQQECDELKQSLVKTKLALHQHEQGNNEREREMEELRRENQKLNAENEKLWRNVLLSTPAAPLPPLSRSYSPPHRIASTPSFPNPVLTPGSNNYPMRANSLSQTPLCDVDFWQKDFAEVLSKNVQLRQDLGKFFDKTIGSEGKGTWEHLLDFLEKRIPDFKMKPAALETKPVGDIILNIVQEWSKKEVVTVEQFCRVSKHELKIPRVEHILKESEEKWRYLTFTEQYSVARPGDSTEESV